MRDSDILEIRQLSFFGGISTPCFDQLTRSAYVQNFPPRIDLIHEADPSDFLHVILDGSVELFAQMDGRESTMAIVRPISTFILAATIRDAPYLMSARTLEKTRIVLLPSSDVRAVFNDDLAFARAVVTELAQCYCSVVKSSKDLKLRSSTERLAHYLLRQRGQAECATVFTLAMEKRRLASYLGMSAENLSRAFKALQSYGVAVNGATVTISNPADLIRLAQPSAQSDGPPSEIQW